MNPKSTMGSVISARHLQRIHGAVAQRSSGTILTGGEPLKNRSSLDGVNFARGSFYPPTVIADVSLDDVLWREEVFGPVVVLNRFEVHAKISASGNPHTQFNLQTECEGVELANSSKYGLGAGIWTQNLSRAHQVAAQLQSGLVWVNTHHRNDPSSPWGGMKESGIGRENGIEAFGACRSVPELARQNIFQWLTIHHADSQSKSTIVNTASAEETRKHDDWFGDEVENKRYG